MISDHVVAASRLRDADAQLVLTGMITMSLHLKVHHHPSRIHVRSQAMPLRLLGLEGSLDCQPFPLPAIGLC